MELTEEDGWQLLSIQPDEDLEQVPSSFSKLLTPEVRSVFADAPGYFRQVATRASHPALAKWLQALVDGGVWQLELFVWEVAGVAEASFAWANESSGAYPASIQLPDKTDLSKFPPSIQQYYSLVGEVQWSPPGNAGQIFGSAGVLPVSRMSHFARELDPRVASTTYTWGITLYGETFVFNEQGDAGWIAVGSDVEIIGSVDEMLESIYGGLLEGKTPQREY